MTSELATGNRQGLPPCLRERAQALLANRSPIRVVVGDQFRGDYVERVALPALTQAEHSLLKQVRCDLLARMVPAQRDEIVVPLVRLANHHRQDRSQAEWKMIFEDFICDLEGFSSAVIEQTCVEHRRISRWFPKIAELRSRCVEIRQHDEFLYQRIERQLLNMAFQ